jgi:hypothetical protein
MPLLPKESGILKDNSHTIISAILYKASYPPFLPLLPSEAGGGVQGVAIAGFLLLQLRALQIMQDFELYSLII